MKINILGASGALGRKIVAELLNRGLPPQDLVLSVRTPEKVMDYAKEGILVRRADYDAPASLESAFRECDRVHLIPSTAAPEPRIQQHANAVEAAEAAGVGRISFSSLSSTRIDSRFLINPFLLYAESKLQLSSMEWTILRNNLYLDPIADWIPGLKRLGFLPYPMKEARIAYVTRDDLAKATATVLLGSGHNGKTYDLTGPESVSMPELAAAVSAAAETAIEFRSVSEEEFAAYCGDEPASILNSLYRAAEAGEFATVTTHIEELCGTAPEQTEDYLRRMCREAG